MNLGSNNRFGTLEPVGVVVHRIGRCTPLGRSPAQFPGEPTGAPAAAHGRIDSLILSDDCVIQSRGCLAGPQQKCLIHLLRDINEDLHKNPFDEGLKVIATQFGALLRDIVATIDTHGLKALHMRKHKSGGTLPRRCSHPEVRGGGRLGFAEADRKE